MEEFNNSADDIYDQRRKNRDRRCILFFAVIIGVVAFIVGIVLGRYVACPAGGSKPPSDAAVYLTNVPKTLMKEADPSMSEKLINGMKPENIRKYLKYVSFGYRVVASYLPLAE